MKNFYINSKKKTKYKQRYNEALDVKRGIK